MAIECPKTGAGGSFWELRGYLREVGGVYFFGRARVPLLSNEQLVKVFVLEQLLRKNVACIVHSEDKLWCLFVPYSHLFIGQGGRTFPI